MQIIDDYGAYSGLKINWQKSALIPFYPQTYSRDVVVFPLKVVFSFKYLGVLITLSQTGALSLNLDPLLQRI